MAFQVYLNKYININQKLLEFIDDDESCTDGNDRELIDFLKQEINCEDRSEFTEFLRLISKISKYHHRDPDFNNKIEKILISFETEIKQTFSNLEIFDIFKSSILILIILFKNKLITVDKFISHHLLSKYSYLFYPEIKTFISELERTVIERNFPEIDLNNLNEIVQKRQIGENDSFICSLIRKDSIEEFVMYVNSQNISLDSRIKPSIYETHSFLIKNKKPKLIEYAAFFGSIQIIQYLHTNKVQLMPSLWLYSIHSNNAELIQFLEENKVESPVDKQIKDKESYIECFNESIKCHHNQIADYLKLNYLNAESNKSISYYALRYHNYKYYKYSLCNDYDFYDLCRYDYSKLVNYYCEMKKDIDNPWDVIYKKLSKFTVLTLKAIKGYPWIEKLAIPPSITSIESLSLHRLVSIVIPSSVKLIESKVFYDCTSLEDIKIPNSVTSIGSEAFSLCKSLKHIIIPISITTIQDFTFYSCESLELVIIPPSVTSIRLGAFFMCQSLKRIVIPMSITSIPEKAFLGCKSLELVIIPPSVTSISDNAFCECESLINLSLPNSLTYIGISAFKDCSSIASLTIPSSVSIIEKFAFLNCSSLKQVIFENPSSLTALNEQIFAECISLSHITFPSSLKIIKKGAFCDCKSLNDLTIPSSVNSIGKNAFFGCFSLEKATIPSRINLNSTGINSKVKITRI